MKVSILVVIVITIFTLPSCAQVDVGINPLKLTNGTFRLYSEFVFDDKMGAEAHLGYSNTSSTYKFYDAHYYALSFKYYFLSNFSVINGTGTYGTIFMDYDYVNKHNYGEEAWLIFKKLVSKEVETISLGAGLGYKYVAKSSFLLDFSIGIGAKLSEYRKEDGVIIDKNHPTDYKGDIPTVFGKIALGIRIGRKKTRKGY
ncbi:MAG: DUF3575 domain-containing protein [Flavobacteriales bacterium]|jgi:hypothetical protein|nr:DUF3575 domain-containing protein [Flavobacteriales bacterium]